jgi:hypothetical protein
MPLLPVKNGKKSQQEKITSKELEARRIGQALSDVAAFIRSTAKTRDFYEGYSLSEAIQERLDFIGGDGQEFTQGARGIKTLLAELDQLETEGLQAIASSRQVDVIREKTDTEGDSDPVQVGNTDTFIVES